MIIATAVIVKTIVGDVDGGRFPLNDISQWRRSYSMRNFMALIDVSVSKMPERTSGTFRRILSAASFALSTCCKCRWFLLFFRGQHPIFLSQIFWIRKARQNHNAHGCGAAVVFAAAATDAVGGLSRGKSLHRWAIVQSHLPSTFRTSASFAAPSRGRHARV